MRAIDLVVLVTSTAVLAACGGDGGNGPGDVEVAGIYYGITTSGPAICDGELPPEVDLSGFAFPLLLDVSQTGGSVSAANLSDTLHYVGTFDGAGGGLAARFTEMPEGTNGISLLDTVTAGVSGSPLRLTATGRHIDSIHTQSGDPPLIVCTRMLAWDLTRRAQPVANLVPVDCSQEAVLRPDGSLASTLMLFRNESPDAVDIYKLDADGQRVAIGHLDPGGTTSLGAISNAVEPLVVTTGAGQCIAIYLPTEGPSYVTIQ
jgi:hypothetical protein